MTPEQKAEDDARIEAFKALLPRPPAPAVVSGRTAEGWMAEALLQKKIADDIRKSAPAVPDDVQHLKNVQELYHSQEERLFTLAQRIKGASFDKYSHTTAQAIDVLEREIFGDDGDACRAAMLDQPVSSGYKLPEGYKLMPLEMTDEIGEAIAMEANCCGGIALDIYDAALAAAPDGGN
ncbi:hypothetical protein I5R69_23740 [Serratia marcescens]|nr:hypothetical protein [Serratia marcescens]